MYDYYLLEKYSDYIGWYFTFIQVLDKYTKTVIIYMFYFYF